MARIFVSYSRADREFLDDLLPLVRKVYGNNCLWYDDEIHGGADWWATILQEIGACELFIFLVSDESLESSYCQGELREALRLNKQILPVIVRRLNPPYPGNVPDDLKSVLNKIQYITLIDLRDTASTANLYAAVNRLLEQVTFSPPQNLQPIPQPPVMDKVSSNRRNWYVYAGVIVLVGIVAAILFSSFNPNPSVAQSASTSVPQATATASASDEIERTQLLFYRRTREGEQDRYRLYTAYQDEEGNWVSEPLLDVDDDYQYYVSVPSPDGERIAFTSTRSGTSNLWMLNVDDPNTYIQLSPGGNISSWDGITWSPDSQRIAFTRNVDGVQQVFVMSVDAQEDLEQVTFSELGISNPAWSPDGRYIIYAKYTSRRSETVEGSRDDRDLWVYDLVEETHRPLLEDADTDVRQAAWSPNGEYIAYVSNVEENVPCEIFRARVLGGDAGLVNLGTPLRLTENTGCDWTPSYSPDGSRIAYQHTSTNSIRVINSASGEMAGYQDLNDDKPDNWLNDGMPYWGQFRAS